MASIETASFADKADLANTEATDLSWMEAAREAVRQGKRGSEYTPVAISGEPLSATILRDRGPY